MRWLAGVLAVSAISHAAAAAEASEVWRTGAADSARHLQSGLICPADLGGLSRVTVAVFDEKGQDVACGYVGGQTALTLYMTRGIEPGAAMADAKVQLVAAASEDHPVLAREDEVHDGELVWRRASYNQDGGVKSDIWIARLPGWIVKYRTTYSPGEAAETARAVETATRAVTASAGSYLAACGAATGC